MCDARLFNPQIAALSKHHALHLAPITGFNSMEGIAANILKFAPEKFAIAGLSMGGILAMEIMAQAPERVSCLCLMSTNPKAENQKVHAWRDAQVAKALAGNLEAVMRDEMKPNYLTDGPKRGQILDLVLDMALGLGSTVFQEQSEALKYRSDQQETLKKVTVPSLILCGEDDALCPIHRHELMHQLIPNSELVVIAGAGHLPTLEQPDITTSTLIKWLER
jgi:pimeloyl-ACP methyl ester carboxylesterase